MKLGFVLVFNNKRDTALAAKMFTLGGGDAVSVNGFRIESGSSYEGAYWRCLCSVIALNYDTTRNTDEIVSMFDNALREGRLTYDSYNYHQESDL